MNINQTTPEAYTYSDVLIKPRFSEQLHRSPITLSTTIGNHHLPFPVVSANMKDVTGPKMATLMSIEGGLGILHRFKDVQGAVDDFKETSKYNGPRAGVSLGVQEEDKYRFEELYDAGARIFCIDVAHGHHLLTMNMLHWINNEILRWDRGARNKVTLIAGNVATPEAYEDLVEWGADAVKVGIGPSPVCRTRYNTGVGVPQLYALQTIHQASMSMKTPKSIIADGGLSSPGDIAKALKYADAVMLGSMLAGTTETPGNVYRNEEREFYKVYGGSSSGENKGENRFVEGAIKMVKFQGKAKYIFKEIREGLQSTFSYVGAGNPQEFKNNCEFVHISAGARGESRI